MATKQQDKEKTTTGSKSYTGPDKDLNLNTQMPLSEKDEVKNAEDKISKEAKKQLK